MAQTVIHVPVGNHRKEQVKDFDRYLINHFNAGFASSLGSPIQYGLIDAHYHVLVNSPDEVQEVKNELVAQGFRITRTQVVD